MINPLEVLVHYHRIYHCRRSEFSEEREIEEEVESNKPSGGSSVQDEISRITFRDILIHVLPFDHIRLL